MKLLFLDKAELLHEDPERVLRTVDDEFSYPSVIRLRSYIRIPYARIALTRKNIMKRDRHTCQYCGIKSDLTLDHIQPKSRGGRDSWENLTTACNKCNVKKGSRTPDEAKMPLRSKPYKPIHITFFQNIMGGVQEDWKPYLYM
ncbi:MAG: HNH endonuclease [Balneolaceae bacterium]|nr:HNH endonuclease [Balneolaceae bacterium]